MDWTLIDYTPIVANRVVLEDLERGSCHEVQVRAQNARGRGGWSDGRSASSGSSANDPPCFSEGSSASRVVEENLGAGADVGEPVSANDPETSDTLTYSLSSSGTDHDSFGIDRHGQIIVAAGGDLDFETRSSYLITVSINDGKDAVGNADTTVDDTIAVTISVTNIEEPGTVSFGSTRPQVGTELTATLTDPDGSVTNETWVWESSSDQTTWTAITGATSASYTAVSEDVGNYLRATVSYTDGAGGGKSAERVSDDTVQAAPVTNEAPAAPTGLTATSGEGQVTLGWSDPADASITSYDVRQKDGDGEFGDWREIPGSDAATTTHTVTGLTNGTEYAFAIRAVNDNGNSEQSDPASATPVAATSSPAKPTGFSAQQTGVGRVRLEWDATTAPLTVTAYQYTQDGGTSWNDLVDSDSGSTSAAVADLTAGTTYHFALRALNSAGPGDATDSQAVTVVGKPSEVTGFTATAQDGRVWLTWDPADDESITRWEYWQRTGAEMDQAWSPIEGSGADTAAHLITGLENGQEYRFRVRSENAAGRSGQTGNVNATPKGDLSNTPLQPRGLDATPGAGEVTLTWTDPNDSSVTKYLYSKDGGTRWMDIPDSAPGGANAISYTVTGLTVGTSYTFQIRAVSSAGNSPASGSVTATPDTPVTNAPPEFPSESAVRSVVENASEGTDVGLPVSATDADNDTLTYSLTSSGSDHDSFTIDSDGQIKVAEGADLDHEAKSTYSVVVTAADPSGATGTISVTINVTNVDEAGAVTLSSTQPQEGAELTASLTDPDGSVSNESWQWASSSDWDASTQTGTWSDISGTNFAAHTPTADDVGNYLRATVSYGDGHGDGKSAQGVTESPVLTKPAVPTGLEAAQTTNGEVTLNWDNPSDSTITGYDYRLSSDGGTNWDPDWTAILGSGATTTSHTVSSLTNGTEYTFEVRAENDLGKGAAAQAKATTNAIELAVSLSGNVIDEANAGSTSLTISITNDVTFGYPHLISLEVGGSASPGVDYTLSSGGWWLARPHTLTLAAGTSSVTVTVAAVDDFIDDDAETIALAASHDGNAIDSGLTVTITDDDDPSGLFLSTLAVIGPGRSLYPPFDSEVYHYAVGCGEEGPITVTASAANGATGLSINGVQQPPSESTTVELTGLTGDSDVIIRLANKDEDLTTYVVHCTPSDFPVLTVTKMADAWDGLVALAVQRTDETTDEVHSYLVVADNNGVPRFHRRIESRAGNFRTHKGGKHPWSYAQVKGSIDNFRGRTARTWEMVVLDEQLNEVALVETTSDLLHTDFHDFVVKPNGNYILMAYEPVERDLSDVTNPHTGQPYNTAEGTEDSVIQEVTPTGSEVLLWNSWDHIAIEDCIQHRFPWDYAHINSLQYFEGDIIASLRGCSQVLRIDGDTGEVIWRLGRSNLTDEEWVELGGTPPLLIVGGPFCPGVREFCNTQI